MKKDNKTTKLSREQVLHIAKLAQIKLREDEIEKMQVDLGKILEYMEVIQEVDTGDESFASQTDLVNILREDIAEQSLTQERAVSNRKDDSKGGAISISAVIKK